MEIIPALWDIWFVCDIQVTAVLSTEHWRQLLVPLVYKAGATEDLRGGHGALPLELGNDREILSIFEVHGNFLKNGNLWLCLKISFVYFLAWLLAEIVHISIGWPDVSTLHCENKTNPKGTE